MNVLGFLEEKTADDKGRLITEVLAGELLESRMKNIVIIFVVITSIGFESTHGSNFNSASSSGAKILKDFVVGDSRSLVPSSRNAKSGEIVSRVNIHDEPFAEISLSYSHKGGKSDWDRTGERNQRWELRDKKKKYNLSQPYFLTYRFRIPTGLDDRGSGSDKYFQIIAANRDGGAWNPVAQLKNQGGHLTFTFYLNYEVFYLCSTLFIHCPLTTLSGLFA